MSSYVQDALYHTFIECQRPDGRPRVDHFLETLERYGCEVVAKHEMDQLRRKAADSDYEQEEAA